VEKVLTIRLDTMYDTVRVTDAAVALGCMLQNITGLAQWHSLTLSHHENVVLFAPHRPSPHSTMLHRELIHSIVLPTNVLRSFANI
jgi:hypothetical protein